MVSVVVVVPVGVVQLNKSAIRSISMVVYGYILAEEKKFTMPVEELCSIINIADGLAPDVYVYTTEEDRDLHYNQNIKKEEEK